MINTGRVIPNGTKVKVDGQEGVIVSSITGYTGVIYQVQLPNGLRVAKKAEELEVLE